SKACSQHHYAHCRTIRDTPPRHDWQAVAATGPTPRKQRPFSHNRSRAGNLDGWWEFASV
ncbi:MAG: hypothetical protein M3Q30_12995, partial [Actinomycetota bacterium]|nr:hypothetical protein [Actinomycetota bacterium]